MRKILSIVKRIVVVFVVLFAIIIGIALIDISNDEVDTKKVKTTNKVDKNITNAQSKKKKEKAQEEFMEDFTRGYMFIVDADGVAYSYAFNDNNKVHSLGEVKDVALGYPYMVWHDYDSDEYALFAMPSLDEDSSNGWDIDQEEFKKIPKGWQNYITSKLNLD